MPRGMPNKHARTHSTWRPSMARYAHRQADRQEGRSQLAHSICLVGQRADAGVR